LWFRVGRLDREIDIRKMDADVLLDLRITVYFERDLFSEPVVARGDQRVIDVRRYVSASVSKAP
jgi:hypothetical protein